MAYDGVNVEEGIAGLNKYRDAIVEIRDDYLTAFRKYNDEISQVWAGENAIKYEEDLDKMLNVPRNLNGTTNELIDVCVAIYVDLTKAHADDFYDKIARIPDATYELQHMHEFIGDLKGINPDQAEDCCQTFINTCKDVVAPKLLEAKLSTGIIDSTGELESSLAQAVIDRHKEFLEYLDEIQATLAEKTKNETVEMRLCVKETEEVLADESPVTIDSGLAAEVTPPIVSNNAGATIE